MKENVVGEKSYAFALEIVRVYQKLSRDAPELARQLLRSGTSVGANVEEAVGAQTRPDFLTKMTIAYKEARESHYWIRLLGDSGYLGDALRGALLESCEELLRIIGSIQKSTKLKTELPK